MFRTAARLATASALTLAVAVPSTAAAAGGVHVASGDLNLRPTAPTELKVKMTDILISSAR